MKNKMDYIKNFRGLISQDAKARGFELELGASYCYSYADYEILYEGLVKIIGSMNEFERNNERIVIETKNYEIEKGISYNVSDKITMSDKFFLRVYLGEYLYMPKLSKSGKYTICCEIVNNGADKRGSWERAYKILEGLKDRINNMEF